MTEPTAKTSPKAIPIDSPMAIIGINGATIDVKKMPTITRINVTVTGSIRSMSDGLGLNVVVERRFAGDIDGEVIVTGCVGDPYILSDSWYAVHRVRSAAFDVDDN